MQVALENVLAIPANDRHLVNHISQRERELLAWCATGKTSWEIGVILGWPSAR